MARIRIQSIVEFLSPDFPFLGTTRLYRGRASKIVLAIGTSIDVFDDGSIIARGDVSQELKDALDELSLLSEGLFRVRPDFAKVARAFQTFRRACRPTNDIPSAVLHFKTVCPTHSARLITPLPHPEAAEMLDHRRGSTPPASASITQFACRHGLLARE